MDEFFSLAIVSLTFSGKLFWMSSKCLQELMGSFFLAFYNLNCYINEFQPITLPYFPNGVILNLSLTNSTAISIERRG